LGAAVAFYGGKAAFARNDGALGVRPEDPCRATRTLTWSYSIVRASDAVNPLSPAPAAPRMLLSPTDVRQPSWPYTVISIVRDPDHGYD
jgi:hypothetical protein